MNSDIATASIGPRSTVATGPEEIQASKWEFEADTERFIQTAEVGLVTLQAGKKVNADKALSRISSTHTLGLRTISSYFHPASLMVGWRILSLHLLHQLLYLE